MKIEEAVRQKKFESSQDKAWINLNYTYQRLNDKFNCVFKEFDITPQQFNVLRILKGRYPGTASCNEVKEVMIDKNPDLTRLSDRLISKGLILRELNEENRRQVILKISETGLELLKKMDPVIKEQAKLFANLNEEEAEQLSDLLDKLRG